MKHSSKVSETDTLAERNAFLDKALEGAIESALMKARTEPWSADAPWIMAFKEWALHHGVEDPSGAMLWADLHIGTILRAVNNFARIESDWFSAVKQAAHLGADLAAAEAARDEARRVAGWRGGSCYDRADYEALARDLEATLRAVMEWFDKQCPGGCPDNALHDRIRTTLIRCNLTLAQKRRQVGHAG